MAHQVLLPVSHTGPDIPLQCLWASSNHCLPCRVTLGAGATPNLGGSSIRLEGLSAWGWQRFTDSALSKQRVCHLGPAFHLF